MDPLTHIKVFTVYLGFYLIFTMSVAYYETFLLVLQGVCKSGHKAFLRAWASTWLVFTEGEKNL